MMRFATLLASLNVASAQLLIGGAVRPAQPACPEDTNSDGSVDGALAPPASPL